MVLFPIVCERHLEMSLFKFRHLIFSPAVSWFLFLSQFIDETRKVYVLFRVVYINLEKDYNNNKKERMFKMSCSPKGMWL